LWRRAFSIAARAAPGLVAGQIVQGQIIVNDGGIGAERQRPVQIGPGLGEAARVVVKDASVEPVGNG
jgi:hypothetical protein